MIKITYEYCRPNLLTDFFIFDSDLNDYIDKTFVQKGKIVLITITQSPDKLKEQYSIIFNTSQDFSDYKNDEIISYAYKLMIKYNIFQKILLSIKKDFDYYYTF
jgi:flavoprotein